MSMLQLAIFSINGRASVHFARCDHDMGHGSLVCIWGRLSSNVCGISTLLPPNIFGLECRGLGLSDVVFTLA
jgi:hypothetical protein